MRCVQKSVYLLSLVLLCKVGLFQNFAAAYTQVTPFDMNQLNLLAGSMIFYEVQARTANACRLDTGADWQRNACANKISPKATYFANGGDSTKCPIWNDLSQYRMGTLDDMLEDTDDYRAGITLKYIKDKVNANTVWLMPVFPNNDAWSLPDQCDNLGSPYAVRDYMHVSANLDRFCIKAGIDDHTAEKSNLLCWGNGALDKFIAKAHSLGLRVVLDVALNHFGHNYMFYDYKTTTPIQSRLNSGQNLDSLWNYPGTYEDSLLRPQIIDTEAGLYGAVQSEPLLQKALSEVKTKCPALSGDQLVRTVGIWREMMDWEKKQFTCETPPYLEFMAPGFFMGQGWSSWGGSVYPHPSTGVGDNFTNNWVDVKFIYHHEFHGSVPGDPRGDYYNVFVRNREYLFRVMNYWVSRGIDGFRLDHTTDGDSGMGPNEWKYIIGKVDFYDYLRKGRSANYSPPIYLAEEFWNQQGMNKVVDVLTEGYVFNMRGSHGEIKNATYVQNTLLNDDRFLNHSFVLHALETHDEQRLLESNTGFNIWTGAGFWGIGAANRGTPMLLVGQEFGESWGLGFKRSSFIPSRFIGHPNYSNNGDPLISLYYKMNTARQDYRNRALLSGNRQFLVNRFDWKTDERLVAEVKWDTFGANPINVIFIVHNLWETAEATVTQTFDIPEDLANKIYLNGSAQYKFVDILNVDSNGNAQQVGPCHSGDDLKARGPDPKKWGFQVIMARSERMQWLRLETCN